MPQGSPKHLLLIGHGFLGHAIAAKFRREGWQVTAVSKHAEPGQLAADVTDRDSVNRLPQADRIIHCAASGRGGPEAYRQVYLEGCRNLISAFPSTPLLFTSSTSVYGQIDGSWVDETSPTKPSRETGELLLDAEDLVIEAGGTVLRLAGLYGPGRSVLLQKFLRGEATIEEQGERFLNQIHRDDAAAAAWMTIGHEVHPGRFNVADDHPLSQLECYQALAEHFQRAMPPNVPRDLNRKRGWSNKRVQNHRIKQLGWRPQFASFLDAVPALVPTLAP